MIDWLRSSATRPYRRCGKHYFKQVIVTKLGIGDLLLPRFFRSREDEQYPVDIEFLFGCNTGHHSVIDVSPNDQDLAVERSLANRKESLT